MSSCVRFLFLSPSHPPFCCSLPLSRSLCSSHAVFRLYENVGLPLDDPLRYYVNVQFSPGAALDPFIFCESDHCLPVSRPVPVNGRIPFHLFVAIFSFSSGSESAPPRGYTQPWLDGHGSNGWGAAAAAASLHTSAVSAAPSPRRA